MKFETVRIHFLSDILVCCHPKILNSICYDKLFVFVPVVFGWLRAEKISFSA